MNLCVADIRREIAEHPARSAWDRGVQSYAVGLFKELVENRHFQDDDILTEKITQNDLLNGANSWSQYSYGGCAEIYDNDICERLCSPSEQKKKRGGDLPPNSSEGWLDVQARALAQAARLVMRIANRHVSDSYCDDCEIGKVRDCPHAKGIHQYYVWKEGIGKPDYCPNKPRQSNDPDELPF